jgi:hypothetical protein
MADSRRVLSVTFVAEGIDTVRREFERLGADGAASAKKISDAFATSSFGKAFADQFRAMRLAAADVIISGQRFSQSWSTAALAVKGFGTAVQGAARNLFYLKASLAVVLGSVTLLAQRFGASAEQITNQASALGLSTDQYQRLSAAARDTGIEQGRLDRILAKFTVGTSEAGDEATTAADGVTKLAKSYEELTLKATDGTDKMVTIRRGAQDAANGIAGFAGVTKKGIEGLKQYATNLSKLKTTQQQLAQVTKDFGARGAAETLTLLRNLSFQFDDAARAAAGLIKPLSQVEISIGLDLDTAFDNLGTNLALIKDRLLAVFAPVITETLRFFTFLIQDNEKSLVKWANTIKQDALQVMVDFLAILRGAPEQAENKWLVDLYNAAVSFGKGVSYVFGTVLPYAFQKLREGAQVVANAINGVFGTSFSGDGLIALLVVLKITGGLAILTATLGVAVSAAQLLWHGFKLILGVTDLIIVALRPLALAVGYLGAALSAALGIPALLGVAIIVALAAAGVAIFVFWDDIVAYSIKAWDLITAATSAAADGIAKAFGEASDDIKTILSKLWEGDVAGANRAFVDQNIREFGRFKDGLQNDVDAINKILAGIGLDVKIDFASIEKPLDDMVAKLGSGLTDLNAITTDLGNGDFGGAFEKIKTQSETFFADLLSSTKTDIANINTALKGIGVDVPAVWTVVSQAAVDAYAEIETATRDSIAFIQSQFETFNLSGIFTTASEAARAAWDEISSSATETAGIVAASFGFDLTATWEDLKAGALDAAGAIASAFGVNLEATWTAIKSSASAAAAAVASAFGFDLSGTWEAIKRGAADVAARVGEVFQFDFATTWEAIKTDAALTWDAIVTSAATLPERLATVWTGISTAANAIWTGLAGAAETAWSGVETVITAVATRIGTAVAAVASATLEAWSGASASVAESAAAITDAIGRATQIAGDVEGARAIAEQLVSPFREAAAEIDRILASLPARIEQGLASAGQGATGLAADIRSLPAAISVALEAIAALSSAIGAIPSAAVATLAERFAGLAQTIATSWGSAMEAIVSQTASMTASVGNLINGLIARLAALRAAIASASSSSSSGSSGPAPEFATGGFVSGGGTGTSDSIPAWLSNGEFVVKARAVRRYGLDFLHAINGMRAPGFAMGGFVGDMAAAVSPSVSIKGIGERKSAAMAAYTLVLGDREFPGFTGPASALAEIGKTASLNRIASAGRSPKWRR